MDGFGLYYIVNECDWFGRMFVADNRSEKITWGDVVYVTAADWLVGSFFCGCAMIEKP